MLTINNLTYRIQGRLLFEGASVVLPDRAKTGLVGRTGRGKTTLFHLIQGHLSVEGGDIEVNRKADPAAGKRRPALCRRSTW